MELGPESNLTLAQLTQLFGSRTAASVLLYVRLYGSGYAGQIARAFGYSQSMVQKQLRRLAAAGILGEQEIERTHSFALNPAHPLFAETATLLDKAIGCLSEEEFIRYFNERRRPRRPGKPLWLQKTG